MGAPASQQHGEPVSQPAEGSSAATPAPGTDTEAHNMQTAEPATAGPPPPVPENEIDERLIKEFYSDMKSVDRDNEVNRIISAFRLNPFEQLGVQFDATPEEIRRKYRKVSLMVHPDKCSHPNAKEAFEMLNSANTALLSEERRREIIHVLNMAKEEVRKDRKKATKHDAAHRLASVLHVEGRDGVEAEYEKSEAFHDAWRLKSRDMLARAEFRRRKLVQRLQDEEKRVEVVEKEMRKKMKQSRDSHKAFEAGREKRIGTWRDYADKTAKKSKVGGMGGIKPPKQKTWDEERTYVQRAVGNTGFQPKGEFKPIQPQREEDD